MLQKLIDRITQSIIHMDIDTLENCLEDGKYYSDLPKSGFLEKMDLMFDFIRSKGDKILIAKSGACASEDCNCGVKGFNFSGPVSGFYFSVIFESIDKELTDVTICSYFKADTSGIVYDNPFKLEYPEFNTNPMEFAEYHILEQNCEAAFHEIVTGKPVFLFTEDIKGWYFKHTQLFKMIPLRMKNSEPLDNFLNLFGAFSDILKCLTLPFVFADKNAEFISNKKQGILYFKYWVSRYQPIYKGYAFMEKYLDRQNFNQGFLELSVKYKIRVSTADIKDVIEFMLNYQEAELMCNRTDLSFKTPEKKQLDTLF